MRHFEIAFKMFDLNGDGEVDFKEFERVSFDTTLDWQLVDMHILPYSRKLSRILLHVLLPRKFICEFLYVHAHTWGSFSNLRKFY